MKLPIFALATSLLTATAPFSNAALVFNDNYAWSGPGLDFNYNANIPGTSPVRQSGASTSTYTAGGNPQAGSFVALESQSPSFANNDALLIRNAGNGTDITVSNLTLDTDFSSGLSDNLWNLSYTARLTATEGIGANNYFGVGFSTTGAPIGTSSSGFFLAIRGDGQWLLWRNGGMINDGTIGNLGGFALFSSTYTVDIEVDETGVSPLLSIGVSVDGGATQNIATQLSLNAFGGNRYFELESAVQTLEAGQFTDLRMGPLTITAVPEPSSVAMLLTGMAGVITIVYRKKTLRQE